MATAIIKFNLDDPDDRINFKRHNKSLDMALAIWDLNNIMRKIDDEKITNKYWDVINNYNIIIEELID